MEENNTIDQNTHDTESYETESLVEEHHSHLAPILGVLLIVLVLILGGLYIWGASLERNLEQPQQSAKNTVNNEPETVRSKTDTSIMETVSTSNSIDALEADLSSTNLDSLGTELDEIDREIENALVE